MFPAGVPGIALLVLRLSVSSMLLLALMPQGLELAALIALSGFLWCGFFTPAACVIAATFIGFHLPHSIDLKAANLAFLIPIILAVGVLGPGAYSVDSMLFGRKLLLTVPESLDIADPPERN